MYKYNKQSLSVNMPTARSGSLELIIGPMYAGKSTELIRSIRRFKCLHKNVLVINHTINNRYGSSSLTTHNRDSFDECIILEHLSDIQSESNIHLFEQADVIVIEELQFFTDAYDNIVDWIDTKGKCVVAAGLDGDFRKQPFGDVLRLIPHAEEVRKLKALCRKCCDGTEAHFTKRTTSDQQTTLVGSDDIYEPVCRYHFLHEDE